MKFDQFIPADTQQMLAQYGCQIEYTDEYPGGLINLTRSEIENDDLRHLVYFPGFDALILNESSISDAGLKFIGRMNQLEILRLEDTLISDDGLRELLTLSFLERLDIGCHPGCFVSGQRPVPPSLVRRNQITDRGLGHLTDLRILLRLNLQATRVTDSGLVLHLPEMPQLQDLSLAYLEITDKGLAAVECLERIERLNLTHTSISNDAIVDLVRAKSQTLKCLDLSNTGINDFALAEFPDALILRDLSLIDTGMTDLGCHEIPRLKHLEVLRLDLTQITDDGVSQFANCKNLQTLELFRTKVTDKAIEALNETNVKHLGLGCTSITDDAILVLSDFRSLQSLDLQRTTITDTGLRYLSSIQNLSTVFLENTWISSDGIKHLLKMPLQSVSLNPELNDSGLKTLSHLESLRHLAIWNNRVSNWQPLTDLERLQVLLIDDSLEDLSPLQSLCQLKVLLLWGNRFSPTEVARLRLSLPTCQVVELKPQDAAICEFRKLCYCC